MLLGVNVLLNGLRKRQLRSSAAFALAGEVFAGQKLRSAFVGSVKDLYCRLPEASLPV